MMTEIDCDVLVAGGGVGGMSAAIAAARCGAKTLLLEKRAELGGTLRAGLDFPVCGFFDSNANLLNDGLSRELVESIDIHPERMGRVYVWPCAPEKLLALLTDLIDAETNLTVSMNAPVEGVEDVDGKIVGITADGVTTRPKAVIDCSGEGAVIQTGSAGRLLVDNRPLAGYSIRFQGLKDDPMLPVKVPHALRKSGLPGYLGFSTFSPPNGLKLAVPQGIGETELQRDIDRVVRNLATKLPAFANAEIVETSPYVLRREGIRLKGEYVLTKEDVLGGAQFDDAVAKGAWPIEYWDRENGRQLEYLPEGVFYEIPLRSLRSPDVRNLFAAGRCISATSEALASARVMGTCIATGEAAGKATANLCA